MAIYLVVLGGMHRGQRIPLPRTQFVIGRDPSCHLRPVSQDVSKFHCAIAHQGERIVIRDLKSTNGTFLNGQRVSGTAKARDGDVLEVGPLQFGFQIVTEAGVRPTGDSQMEWLLRSPNELENKVLDPGQDTTIIHMEKLVADDAAVPPPERAGKSQAPTYSNEATVVAGRFLRDYMATRKKEKKPPPAS